MRLKNSGCIGNPRGIGFPLEEVNDSGSSGKDGLLSRDGG